MWKSANVPRTHSHTYIRIYGLTRIGSWNSCPAAVFLLQTYKHAQTKKINYKNRTRIVTLLGIVFVISISFAVERRLLLLFSFLWAICSHIELTICVGQLPSCEIAKNLLQRVCFVWYKCMRMRMLHLITISLRFSFRYCCSPLHSASATVSASVSISIWCLFALPLPILLIFLLMYLFHFHFHFSSFRYKYVEKHKSALTWLHCFVCGFVGCRSCMHSMRVYYVTCNAMQLNAHICRYTYERSV